MKLSTFQMLDRLPGLKRLVRNSLENNYIFRSIISRFMAIQSAHLMTHGNRQFESDGPGNVSCDIPTGPDRDQHLRSAARRIIARHYEL